MKHAATQPYWSDARIKAEIKTLGHASQAWESDPALRQEFGEQKGAFLAYVTRTVPGLISGGWELPPEMLATIRAMSAADLDLFVQAEQAMRAELSQMEAAGFSDDVLRGLNDIRLAALYAASGKVREQFHNSWEGFKAYVSALRREVRPAADVR